MAGGTGYSEVRQHHGKRAGRTASSAEMLEDEICRLRKRMERVYLEDDSLHSERVIEVSRKLDKKINEYMRKKLRCGNG
jgi:cell division septum initiation protein DivIVA